MIIRKTKKIKYEKNQLTFKATFRFAHSFVSVCKEKKTQILYNNFLRMKICNKFRILQRMNRE